MKLTSLNSTMKFYYKVFILLFIFANSEIITATTIHSVGHTNGSIRNNKRPLKKSVRAEKKCGVDPFDIIKNSDKGCGECTTDDKIRLPPLKDETKTDQKIQKFFKFFIFIF